jgi:hypothetical protein
MMAQAIFKDNCLGYNSRDQNFRLNLLGMNEKHP